MTSPLVDRFRESMIMNHERWHDGAGYDLALLATASVEDRAAIESLLLSRGLQDWRDVEALAALGTPTSLGRLRQAYDDGDPRTRAMILAHASGQFSTEERTDAIVAALEDEAAADHLTQVMLEVEEHHPPRVMAALLRGVRTRDARTAGEFAMMLLFLHGHAESPWDMAPRAFILRFQDEEREPLFRELCARLGVSPDFPEGTNARKS